MKVKRLILLQREKVTALEMQAILAGPRSLYSVSCTQ